ncbi:MAG: acyl-CoA thioesterase [Saccharofermentanales bacterium]
MSTSHVQIVMASHCNGIHRLFGGQLLSWVDVVAAVEARRHARSGVTLKMVDNLTFLSPVFMDETVSLEATITWSGRTSMEIMVNTYVEKIDGSRNLVNKAYLVFVAIDDDGNPIPVRPFVPATPEQEAEMLAAAGRRRIRLGSSTKV